MKREQVPPLNLSEYENLFDLMPEDLSKKIIDFPAGLNSFSAEMFQRHHSVVACDEIYTNPEELKLLSKKVLTNDQFDQRETIVKQFDADFQIGLKQDRYVAKELPKLPFSNYQFDLMLSSFFFFSNEIDLDTCWNNLIEMLRVATEVRISPMLPDKNLEMLLGPLMLKLQAHSFGIEVRSIAFPKLPNSAMLRVWSNNCQLT